MILINDVIIQLLQLFKESFLKNTAFKANIYLCELHVCLSSCMQLIIAVTKAITKVMTILLPFNQKYLDIFLIKKEKQAS